MRITMKIAAAGETYLSRFPLVAEDMKDWKTAEDRFDYARARADLKDYGDFIQFSNKDSVRTVAFGVEFLRQICSTFSKAVEDPKNDARMQAEKSVDRSLMRKMEHDRFGYCRFDIDEVGAAIRVRVGVANPKGVVGSVVRCAYRFAVDCARVLNYLKDGFKDVVEVKLIGREGCVDIFDEAAWVDEKVKARDAIEALNEKRRTCSRKLGEYCSPVDAECPCQRGGKCYAAELDKKWDRYQ